MATELFRQMEERAMLSDCSPLGVLAHYRPSDDILDCVAFADEMDAMRREFLAAMEEVTPMKPVRTVMTCPMCGDAYCSRAVMVDLTAVEKSLKKALFS